MSLQSDPVYFLTIQRSDKSNTALTERLTSAAGKCILKLGLYPTLPTPEWEAFASQRQKWEVPIEGTIQYSTKSFGDKVPGSI